MLRKWRVAYALLIIHFLVFSSASRVISAEVGEVPRRQLQFAEIILDTQDRISDEFSVPPALVPRVGFWFDVYTRYSSYEKIIHHQKYPWWIAEVVDVSPILSLPARAQWLNVEKANRHVQSRINKVRSDIRKLAKKYRKNQPLNEEETALLAKVQLLPGSVKKNLREIPGQLRIQTGQKDFYLTGLEKSRRYVDYMEKVFTDRGLPSELTRLPLVESSFNENAGSKVGALGIWQIMPNIGQKFVKMNSVIDERRSPFKATYVAARLFRENIKLLDGAWPLAVTAYNHGPGGLRKAVKKLGTDKISVIIKEHKSGSFGFASSNFYTSFLAALLADAYSQEIFGDIEHHDFVPVERLLLPKSIRAKKLLSFSQLSEEEFLAYNPDLRKAVKINALLPKNLAFYLPQDQVNAVLEEVYKYLNIARM